jgi:hypothetical protein
MAIIFLLQLKNFGSLVWFSHGLINYKDTKAKCRYLKKLTCKGTLQQVFIRVYGLGDTFSHAGIFDPAL